MSDLSLARLDTLVEEAIVDVYAATRPVWA
jgi:hypothetical protein